LAFFCTPGQTVANAIACAEWQAASDVGSGVVAVTILTPTHAAGTFTLTMAPFVATAPMRIVTNGAFDVQLQ